MSPPAFPWMSSLKLKLVDVGAMWLGEGMEAYAHLMRALPCEVVGFEPLPAECRKLEAMGRPGHTYLPYFVGDGTSQTFYECAAPYTSSLLEPNLELISRFQGLADLMQVVRTGPVQTTRLDDIPQTAGLDYLKIDVQGGEMMVLEGARERLKSTLVIHTEVEFLPLYKNQPLFGDVDALLRAEGFVLHSFSGIAGRVFKPLMVNNNPFAAGNQVLWSDAIYIRDFQALDALDSGALLKLAAILHANYGSVDLVHAILTAFDRREGANCAAPYLETLAANAPVA